MPPPNQTSNSPGLTKEKLDALPREPLDPAKLDLSRGGGGSPVASAVSEMKRINALNLEPAQPRLPDAGNRDKPPSTKQTVLQMRSSGPGNLADLKREFRKSADELQKRMDGGRDGSTASAEGAAAAEGKRSALNANATAFTPTGRESNSNSGDGAAANSKTFKGGGRSDPVPDSSPSFTLQPAQGGRTLSMGGILDQFCDKCKERAPAQDPPEWPDATGGSYRDVFGAPTQQGMQAQGMMQGQQGQPGMFVPQQGMQQPQMGWQQPPQMPPQQPPQQQQQQGGGGGGRGGKRGDQHGGNTGQQPPQQQQQQQPQPPPMAPQGPYMMAPNMMMGNGMFNPQMAQMYGQGPPGPQGQGMRPPNAGMNQDGQGPPPMQPHGQGMVFNGQQMMMGNGQGGFMMPMGMMPAQGMPNDGSGQKFGGQPGQQMMMPVVMGPDGQGFMPPQMQPFVPQQQGQMGGPMQHG